MGHNHNHEQPASLKNLVFAMVINGGIVAFEMVFGLLIFLVLYLKAAHRIGLYFKESRIHGSHFPDGRHTARDDQANHKGKEVL